MEDAAIIDLYFNRDENAITQTAQKYGKALLSLSYKIVDNNEDAEECVNDTYHKTWTHIPPTRPEFLFAFIAKITRNLSLDKLEYKHAQKRSMALVELDNEIENCIPAPDDYERKRDSDEIGSAISNFLSNQPMEMRVIFVRRYWYMDSISDISVMYNISESKVKSVLFRMRNKLREHLEREGIAL